MAQSKLFVDLRKFNTILNNFIRMASSATSVDCGDISAKSGLVIGAYDGCLDGCCGEVELTKAGTKFDASVEHKISKLMKGVSVRSGTVHTFTNVSPKYAEIAVVGVGSKRLQQYNELENLDEVKENIRVAAGVGARILQKHGMEDVIVEDFDDAEAAAEGSHLAIWQYQDNKNDDDKRNESKVDLLEGNREQWDRGVIKAEAQNVARCLCEIPGNLLTPTLFARRCIEILCPYGVQVYARDRKWMEQKRMYALLSAARGSCEAPIFLQLDYCGAPSMHEKSIAIIGKGTTFNCGGLCLKECEGMSEFRAEMSGAACVVATFKAVAAMRLPINIHGIIPLFENMISGMAMKPGDVVIAQNGKVIRDEQTDNYSRFALTDAIAYSTILRPSLIMNIATMSEGIKATLGGGPSAVFSTDDDVWEQLAFAGSLTGDRMWRMPLFKSYRELVTDYMNCDINNVGKGIGGGACLGAAFLLESAPVSIPFVYIDNTGTGMLANGFIPYLTGGLMSGRPTRTLIQFLCHKAYDCNKEELDRPDPQECLEEHEKPKKGEKFTKLIDKCHIDRKIEIDSLKR